MKMPGLSGTGRTCLLWAVLFTAPQAAHGATLEVAVTGADGAVLPDVVVYLVPLRGIAAAAVTDLTIEQKNKLFIPLVSVAGVGSRVRFPNRDGIGHHVYSFSPAKRFQLALTEQEDSEAVVLDKTGVITVGCNIHDWMVAYILVVDSPYYGKTDADGSLSIDDLPADDYQVHVWHPGMAATGEAQSPVHLAGDDSARLEFRLVIRPGYLWRPEPRTEEQY